MIETATFSIRLSIACTNDFCQQIYNILDAINNMDSWSTYSPPGYISVLYSYLCFIHFQFFHFL